ncbi:Peptidase family M23 [Cnuella takakiae]|uniref:Peptidase family M23 n=1 Tax=Cnuella takakiae TaxID=1302690 RepID=A0A1M5HQ64_9BACT|nr:M23 family metallopeptidase [Cnuella takakiae]OLY95712.1 hypothetical protein BUE76_00385 [Cnuella takakiae]SHG18093.1 Peptidase family M23 [Cnuella takakiae]
MLLILLPGLQVSAQLSTVGVSGRKLSKAVQRGLEKPEQDTMRLSSTNTSAYNKGEKENKPIVWYPIRKPLFHPPLKRIRVTSSYGKRYHPVSRLPHFHNGVDLEANYEPVMAVAAGRVKKVGFDERSGLYVVLDHGQGITTSYAHLKYALAEIEQLVEGGKPIGVSGNTGRSTAPHLHFSIKLNNLAVDPINIFR